MKIKINGEEKKLDLDQENSIVVELNNLIINSKKWGEVKLKDGDNLEIVSIVGGG